MKCGWTDSSIPRISSSLVSSHSRVKAMREQRWKVAKFFWVIFLPVVSSGVLLRVHPDGPDDERKSTFIFFFSFNTTLLLLSLTKAEKKSFSYPSYSSSTSLWPSLKGPAGETLERKGGGKNAHRKLKTTMTRRETESAVIHSASLQSSFRNLHSLNEIEKRSPSPLSVSQQSGKWQRKTRQSKHNFVKRRFHLKHLSSTVDLSVTIQWNETIFAFIFVASATAARLAVGGHRERGNETDGARTPAGLFFPLILTLLPLGAQAPPPLIPRSTDRRYSSRTRFTGVGAHLLALDYHFLPTSSDCDYCYCLLLLRYFHSPFLAHRSLPVLFRYYLLGGSYMKWPKEWGRQRGNK